MKTRPTGYTLDELCTLAELAPADAGELARAGLLRPRAWGEYQPRQVGWARRLAFLLGQGWTVEQIKCWTAQRWTAARPGDWPPSGPPAGC